MDPEVGIWNLALSSQAGTLGSRIPLRLLSLALVTAEHLGSPKTKTNININMQESIMLCWAEFCWISGFGDHLQQLCSALSQKSCCGKGEFFPSCALSHFQVLRSTVSSPTLGLWMLSGRNLGSLEHRGSPKAGEAVLSAVGAPRVCRAVNEFPGRFLLPSRGFAFLSDPHRQCWFTNCISSSTLRAQCDVQTLLTVEKVREKLLIFSESACSWHRAVPSSRGSASEPQRWESNTQSYIWISGSY